MTPAEAVALCRYAKACCPQQAFDEYTPDAWGDLLHDIRFEDAKQAIVEHAMEHPFVSPAEIRARVRRIRRDRVNHFGTLPDPPAEIDPDDHAAYRRWLAGTIADIADGLAVGEEPRGELKARDVAALGLVGKPVPGERRPR